MTSIVNRFGASLTEDAKIIIYYHHMFIVHATELTFTTNRQYVPSISLLNDMAMVFKFERLRDCQF